MATNLAIDEELLEAALKIGRLPSKRVTVNEALREFIARRKRKEALDVVGTIEFVEGFDAKALRKKR